MGRKKGHIVTLKPFCYYCDKEFNNELILHQHQKARHFNCAKCKKRFSTAPALDTHELQVHRSSLKRVPNAKAGRDSFDISIYGMDGVPIELINYKLAEKVEQKKRKLIKEHKIAGNEEVRRFLENLGFVAGSQVSVISKICGNVIVQIKESRVAISKEMAQKIIV